LSRFQDKKYPKNKKMLFLEKNCRSVNAEKHGFLARKAGEMKRSSLGFLCCPSCHGSLSLNVKREVENEIISGLLTCEECGGGYRIEGGIPDLLLHREINEKDKKWMKEYDEMARSYDILMCHIIPFFSLGLESFNRYRWMKRLQVGRGAHVLDISTGTGRNLPFIIRQVGFEGRITAMDISRGMLAYAKAKAERKGWSNVEFQRANASRLPYKDNTFDAVMHVGGINTFGEKKRALHEMVRVAKPKAKILVVDEGLAPGKEKTAFGRFLLRTNALYWHKPPVKLLPKNADNLMVDWGIIVAWPFYSMEFQKLQEH